MQMTTDVYDGGADHDRLLGTSRADVVLLSSAGVVEPPGVPDETPRVIGIESFVLGDGHDALNLSGTGCTRDVFALGGTRSDVLRGDAGNEQLFGEGGSDFVVGGAGSDVILGGDGAVRDVFGFGDFANAGIDHIKDFGKEDTLRIVGSGVKFLTGAGIQVATTIVPPSRGQPVTTYDNTVTVTGDFTTIIHLTTSLHLAASNHLFTA